MFWPYAKQFTSFGHLGKLVDCAAAHFFNVLLKNLITIFTIIYKQYILSFYKFILN